MGPAGPAPPAFPLWLSPCTCRGVTASRHIRSFRATTALLCLALLPFAGCGSTEVSQLAGPENVRCLADITGVPTSVPATASQATAVIVTERECAWTATSNSSWLTVTPGEGQGETTVTVSVAANSTSSSRSGTVTVNGVRVTVTQAAGSSQQPPPPSLSFDGTVSNLFGVCPVLTFTVAGRQVVTDVNTRFTGGNCGSVRNGRSVEIEGEPLSGTVVRATRVRM